MLGYNNKEDKIPALGEGQIRIRHASLWSSLVALAISYLTTSNVPWLMDLTFPVSYAILFFTSSDFTSITSHIHKRTLFSLWLCLFILHAKQEMTRVNINILGIGELKLIGMSEFNSDDHYIYYCGQESLRRNGLAHIVNKSLKYSTWVNSQKQQNDLSLFTRKNLQQASGGDRIPAELFEILKDDAIKVLQSMYSWFLQPSPTLCYPMDCSSPALVCYSLLQGIFLTQGSNLHLLHYRQILYR